jgi:hypothetical protein
MALQTQRGRNRMVLNRKAFDAITLAAADGLFEMGKAIVAGADVPDAPPLTKGLVEGGGVIAYVKGSQGAAKKVAETTIGGQTIKKPRAARIKPGATVIVGFGFPGRFVELGTATMPAQPFLTPALMERIPDAGEFVRVACIKRRATSAGRAAKGDVFAKATP